MFFSIAQEFTTTPGLRYRHQSEYSGEEFREDYLRKMYSDAVSKGEILTIDLDGTFGYPDSFISEAFGGLAREQTNTPRKDIIARFQFISKDQSGLIEKIHNMMLNEDER